LVPKSLDHLPCIDHIYLPLDQCPPLKVAHRLGLHPLLLEPFPHLELVEMLVWKMIVDIVLVKALRILLDTHPRWTCSLERRMEPLHHLIHQDQLALLGAISLIKHNVSGTIIRGTLKTPNSQLVTPISIKLQRPDGYD
jgi:hypothetical protein